MKKQLKKLSLKKETIVNLNDVEMNAIRGGSITTSSKVCTIVIEYTTEKVSEYIINEYTKSKNQYVYMESLPSRDYIETVCCISDFEIVC